MNEPAPRIHRLKITLDNVNPPIWRVIEVESDWPIDFVADAIRRAFGRSSWHAYQFVIKGRDYGIQNAWFRNDPKQMFEESSRRLRKQKPNPPEEQKAMAALHKTLQSSMEKEETDDDTIRSLVELVPRVLTKFKFIFNFGDWWECGSSGTDPTGGTR